MFRIQISVWIVLFASQVFASGMTLPELLLNVANNNPQLVEQTQQSKQVFAANTWLDGRWIPTIDFRYSRQRSEGESSYDYFSGSSQSSSSATSNSQSSQVVLDWAVFRGGQHRLDWKQFTINKDRQLLQQKVVTERVIKSVLNVYFKAVLVQQQVALHQQAVNIADDVVKKLEIQQQFGTRRQLDVISAKVSRNLDQKKLLDAQSELSKLIRQLTQLMGDTSFHTFDLSSNAFQLIRQQEFLEIGGLKKSAMTYHALFRELEIANRQYRTDRLRAVSQVFPTISTSAAFQMSDQSNSTGFIKTSDTSTYQLGLTAHWRLFQGGKVFRALKIANLEQDRLQTRAKSLSQQFDVSLHNAVEDYAILQDRLLLDKEGVELSKLQFDRTKSLHERGQQTQTELQQAKLTYFQSQFQILQTQYFMTLKELDLLESSGQLLRMTEQLIQRVQDDFKWSK